MTNDCICSNVPRIWRLAGVTRTVRLTVTKDGSPYDFTGLQTVLRIDRDNSDFHYEPQFTVEGDDNNIIVFTWAADKQPLGDYTIEVTVTDGSGNKDRVNWHGATGVRLVEYSNLVKGEDAAGVESDSELGLDGIFTMNGVGMDAYEEWLADGNEGSLHDYILWMQGPAREAAEVAEAQMAVIQSRADDDHTTAESDHTRAGSDHTTATGDHTRAEEDHQFAFENRVLAYEDHLRAEDDHTTAAADHTTAQADHATAGSDHTRAESDHSTAASDHTTAASDHTKAGQDSTRAGSDHDIAVADHAQAEADHTRAEGDHTTAAADHTTAAADHTQAASDHTTAAADHTQAVADHAVMAGYDTRLTNVETDVTQLGQEATGNVISTANNVHVPYSIKSGEKYFITNNSGYQASVYFRVAENGTGQLLVGNINIGQTILVEPTNNYNYIYIYDSQARSFSITIKSQDALQSQINALGDKLIKLSAFGTASPVNIGDVAYITSAKKLSRRINQGSDSSAFEIVPFEDGAIYSYNNLLYIWNGSDLVIAWNSINSSISDLAENTKRDINAATPYLTISEANGEVQTYHPANIKQGHTYRLQKTENYSYASTLTVYLRVDKSSTGQSYVNIPTTSSYVDFLADKDYNWVMFYNATTTAGGTEEVYFYDLAELLRSDISGIGERVSQIEEIIENGEADAIPHFYLDGWKISSGLWDDNANNSSIIISVKPGDAVASTNIYQYAWLASFIQPTHWAKVPFVPGTSNTNVNGPLSVTAPAGAKYLCVAASYNNGSGQKQELHYDNLTINGILFDSVIALRKPSILISKHNSTYFYVKVYSEGKREYLTHAFYHHVVQSTMEYGSGQTKTVLSNDCWWPTDITDKDETLLVQGNINFINSIKSQSSGTFENEGAYVGEGHGCAVAVFTKFFADGVEFDPMSLTGELKCDTFRVVEKVNHYASNINLTSGGITYPKLDRSGNMILACVHYADALYERDNKISIVNRLTVKRDNTIFQELFAGMARVYLPTFSHVVLNDAEDTANAFSHDGTDWTFTDEGDSGILINNTPYLKGSNLVYYGDDYIMQQTIQQESRPWNKLNYRIQIYNDTIKSVKVYQQPAICSLSASSLGEQAEEFMNGDVIECKLSRKIESRKTDS